jgi:CHAT domain-containing protein/tetratricopeptide (TPR) repeat protein
MVFAPPDLPNPQSGDALTQTVLTWLTIEESERKQRGFLEAHPELLDPRSDAILKEYVGQANKQRKKEKRLHAALCILGDAQKRVLAREQDVNNVVTAIREAYVDMYGGLVLDVPGWLEDVEHRLTELWHGGQSHDTSAARIELIRHAIAHAQNDHQIVPETLAALQSALAIALKENPLADRAQTLEEALVLCTAAMQIYTLARYPRQYVIMLNTLGLVHRSRVRGERWKNLEESITHFQEALHICELEGFSEEHAQTEGNLAVSFRKRVVGERRENIEQAIACFQEALRVHTLEDFPIEYAQDQNALGNAYDERIEGNRRENIEQAIACYQKALRVRTPERYPMEYAHTQNNLGISYRKRIAGDRRENIERAISCFREKLRIHTLERFPIEYARTQNNLANAYYQRIEGERPENLEYAITCFREALRVFTWDSLRYEYAKTQNNLGNIYVERIEGERRENLECAITCFREALRVFTTNAHPGIHRLIELSCAETEAQLENWSAVHESYTHALESENLLVALGVGVPGHDVVLKEGRAASTRDGFALLRLGRVEDAVVAIERGRARWLAEAMAFDAADPAHIGDLDRRERYIAARQSFINAQAVLHTLLAPELDEEARRRLGLEYADAYRKARDRFYAVVAEVRKAHDPEDFLYNPLDTNTILHALERLGVGHTLVYLAATPWSGFAIAAFGENPYLSTSIRVAALDLPSLTDELVDGLLETKLEGDAERIIGGFNCAQQGTTFEMLKYWPGQTAREKATSLHAACERSQKSGTLDKAMQQVLTIVEPKFAYLFDKPLTDFSEIDEAALAGILDHALLEQELQRCSSQLVEVALRPLQAWLREEGAVSVTLIPCGALAAFPLLTLPLDGRDGQTLSEIMPTSIVPNARSLLRYAPIGTQRTGVYAMGNPYPTQQSLVWGEAEASTIAELGKQLGLFGHANVQWDATRPALIDALQSRHIVAVSCHGRFDTEHFLNSHLRLADGEILTLADMLNREANLSGLRLFILSACQTAILDLHGARDEVRSLAVGALQAGAQAVLAALWPVDDEATYLLMVRFAQEWLPRMGQEPPAAALARAQYWLRTVTNRELQEWRSQLPPVAGKPREPAPTIAVRGGRGYRLEAEQAEELIRRKASRSDPDTRPYTDPYYWAAFQITGW